MVKRGQVKKEETNITNNRAEIIQKFHNNANNLTHWILTDYQDIMALYILYPEIHTSEMDHHRDGHFTD